MALTGPDVCRQIRVWWFRNSVIIFLFGFFISFRLLSGRVETNSSMIFVTFRELGSGDLLPCSTWSNEGRFWAIVSGFFVEFFGVCFPFGSFVCVFSCGFERGGEPGLRSEKRRRCCCCLFDCFWFHDVWFSEL